MSEPTVVVIEPQETSEPPAAPIAVVEAPEPDNGPGPCCVHCVEFATRIQALEDAATVTASAVEQVSETAESAQIIAEVAADTASEAIEEVVAVEEVQEVISEPASEPTPEIEPKSKVHPFFRKRVKMEG